MVYEAKCEPWSYQWPRLETCLGAMFKIDGIFGKRNIFLDHIGHSFETSGWITSQIYLVGNLDRYRIQLTKMWKDFFMNWVPTFFFDASLLHIIWVIMLVFVKKIIHPLQKKCHFFLKMPLILNIFPIFFASSLRELLRLFQACSKYSFAKYFCFWIIFCY